MKLPGHPWPWVVDGSTELATLPSGLLLSAVTRYKNEDGTGQFSVGCLIDYGSAWHLPSTMGLGLWYAYPGAVTTSARFQANNYTFVMAYELPLSRNTGGIAVRSALEVHVLMSLSARGQQMYNFQRRRR
jgi:hypothetical protein